MKGDVLRFLLDTNVLIPLEPTQEAHAEGLTPGAARLVGLCAEARFPVFIHPGSRTELGADKNSARRQLRAVLLDKYALLPDPPAPQAQVVAALGTPPQGTHDWYDQQLIAAVCGNAVSFLVTEDAGLRRKSRRVGVGDRIVGVEEATAIVEGFLNKAPLVPPAVRSVRVHAIDIADAILDSFRSDYPNFDAWFANCQHEHRQAWIIDGEAGALAAIAIVKDETEGPIGWMRGKGLKVCSFKVSDSFKGHRYGELLLKAVFEHSHSGSYEWAYVTVLPKYAELIVLLQQFGFERTAKRTQLGEAVLVKRLRPASGEGAGLPALAYHIRYGPRAVPPSAKWFLVPIQPRFARALFPESGTSLFAGRTPFGNALRKAYLCHSPIRGMPSGSVLAFYRSQEAQGAIALGVVETAVRSSSSAEIGRLVARRTVYSAAEIGAMCDREVLIVLFRQVVAKELLIGIDELLRNNVCKRAPQSIMTISPGGVAWLREALRV